MTSPANPSPKAALEGIQGIRERWQKATPGPWGWFGHVGHGKDLSSNIRLSSRKNGNAIMMFRRVQKTNGAQPYFQHLDPTRGVMVPARNFVRHEQPYRTHINGITHPDAEAIAAAPEDVRILLEEVDRLTAQLPYWKPVAERPSAEGQYLCVLRGYGTKNLVQHVLYFSDREQEWWGLQLMGAEITHWMPLPAVPEGMEWK